MASSNDLCILSSERNIFCCLNVVTFYVALNWIYVKESAEKKYNANLMFVSNCKFLVSNLMIISSKIFTSILFKGVKKNTGCVNFNMATQFGFFLY